MNSERKNIYNLSDFLLSPIVRSHDTKHFTNPSLLRNEDIVQEISSILRYIKPYVRPDLTGFRSYKQKDRLPEQRHAKADLFMQNQVYDKFIKKILQEYLVIAIAFLRRIYSMHSAKIICGNIIPESFIFDRVDGKVYRDDLHIVFSDMATVRAEEHSGIDMIFVKTNIRSVQNNKYLAPELVESVVIAGMKQRLHDLKNEAEHRELSLHDTDQIERALKDLHQTQVKYTDKAESYSVGYVLIELLSNMITRLVYLNITDVYDMSVVNVDPSLVAEAAAMLPDQFDNPGELKLLKLLNETVSIIYGLMEVHVDKRRSIKGAIYKLKSVLRRLLEEPPTDVNDTSETILDKLRSRRRKS